MQTDYSRIADHYDRNPLREKAIDKTIADFLDSDGKMLRIMDIACGTGNYLRRQREHYRQEFIEWIGVDASESMLAYARKKNPGVEFYCCSVEELPDHLKSIKYIRNEFAFHHFTEKQRAAGNIFRALASDGLFVLVNICPEYMKHNWVYEYFPGARNIDAQRFLNTADLFELLRRSGFTVEMQITTRITCRPVEELLSEARNRDMSQLHLIDEAEYERGIEKLEHDVVKKRQLLADVSLLECRCRKSSR